MAHAELGPFAFEELVALRAQGVLHALVQGDVEAFDFEVPCGVGNAFLHPAVAGDAGDADEIDVRRVGQHDHGRAVVEHFHHVGVQQHFFLRGLLRAGGQREQADRTQQRGQQKASECHEFVSFY